MRSFFERIILPFAVKKSGCSDNNRKLSPIRNNNLFKIFRNSHKILWSDDKALDLWNRHCSVTWAGHICHCFSNHKFKYFWTTLSKLISWRVDNFKGLFHKSGYAVFRNRLRTKPFRQCHYNLGSRGIFHGKPWKWETVTNDNYLLNVVLNIDTQREIDVYG